MGEMERSEEIRVHDLGESIGYGRMMQLAEKLWGKKLEASGASSGGAHSVGPCVAELVPCICSDHSLNPVGCDWCCGSARVTKRVKDAAVRSRSALTELDVRHIVATEMARVMLSHVLVSENSQVVARAREMQAELGKLNTVCHELDKQRKEAIEQRDKWKADGQQWAGDYLKLARMLGVPETVRDRSVVAEAERIAQTDGANTMKLAVESVQHVVLEVLGSFERAPNGTVSAANLAELLRRRFDELAAGGA